MIAQHHIIIPRNKHTNKICQFSYCFAFLFQKHPQTMTYYKYSSSSPNTQTQQTASQKRRKNKQKNKPREVKSWNDIDENGNLLQTQKPQDEQQQTRKPQRFIPPKYTQDEIKKMKWADIDEMSDEDFYGYFVDID